MQISKASPILRKSFKRKRKEGAKYSMRWLAKNLEISPAMMSNVLSGKRNLPTYLVDRICELLDISSEERDYLLKTRLETSGYRQHGSMELAGLKTLKQETTQLDWQRASNTSLDVFKKWYYTAILEVTNTRTYNGTTNHLARRLNITVEQVKTAMDEMIDAGLMKFEKGKWVKCTRFLELQSQKNPDSIRRLHVEHMENAKINLLGKTSDEDRARRFISGMTVTTSAAQVTATRIRIMDFMEDLSKQFMNDEPDKVYHFGVQFFPLAD